MGQYPMDFGWYPLLLGLALGLLPPRWFYPDGCRHLSLLDARTSGIHRPGGASGARRRRRWWKLPLIWLDPLRGYACGHLSALGLGAIPQTNSGESALVTLLQCALVAAVLVMQMETGRQEKGQLLAPVAFLVGLTAGLYLDFTIVGAAVGLLALATMVATHSFAWGYIGGGAAAGVIGFAFLGLSPALVVFAVTACAPVLYAFIRQAPLVFPLRG